MLDVMIYLVIFIMGTVFGSFFTLAIYRLPRKENITYVRSHCTTCNHNLNFWDLIPVWSYLFLGGKCRYCKSKIRSRYILLEIFSGLAFMLIAYTFKISAYSTLLELINLFFIYLFFCAIYIIGGIDKETLKIHNGTLIYGIAVALAYGLFNAYFYGQYMTMNLVGFLAIPSILLIVVKLLKKLGKDENKILGFGDIKYIAMLGLFMGLGLQILAILVSIVIALVAALIKKYKDIPFGYFLSIGSVIVLVFSPYLKELTDLMNITFFIF